MAIDRNTDQTTGSTMGGVLGGANNTDDEKKKQEALAKDTADISTPLGSSSVTKTSTPSQAVKPMPATQKAGTGTFANLKSYLQASQGGGKVAQAATQRVQNVAGQAQKGISQAQQTFGQRMGAGSGALFQGTTPGQYLTNQQASQAAHAESARILGAATSATYQAPQAASVTTGEQAPAQAAAPQTQQYFDPKDIETYSNIINAQYQGPMSLQQAGLYEQAARRAQTAQQALEQTKTAGGREALLRDIFGRTRDYSRGASKLDALLLNTSQQGVQQLQQQAQQAGNIQQQLQQAQNVTANEAAQRAAAIEAIRSGAREQFTTAREQEEAATEAYIKNIQENWEKLPEYFRNVLTESKAPLAATARVGEMFPDLKSSADINKYYDYRLGRAGVGDTYNLSREEAAILGLQPGAGLYGIKPEDIQASAMAERGELITKDQLSRQLALASLAGLDTSKGLQKALEFSDLEKAGTKDILSSLDTAKLQRQMAEKQQEMEKELERQRMSVSTKTGPGRFDWAPTIYSGVDLLRQGGYIPTDMAGMSAEDSSANILRNIAQGGEYSPTTEATGTAGAIQKAYESLLPSSVREQLLASLGKTQDIMKKYGGLDTTQIVENEKTKARAEALRNLLGSIYKNG